MCLSDLPTELIIDISHLNRYPKNMYKSFGIHCWHGYNSNPKTIELLFNTNNSKDNFISLGTFNLELKAGKQIFPLDYKNIRDNVKSIKYLKIIIKENYGSDWTYINQIMLYDVDYQHIINEYFDNDTNLQNSSEQKSKNTENDLSISNDESSINTSKYNNNNYSRNEESYLPINQNNYNEYLEQSLKKEKKSKKNEKNLYNDYDIKKNFKNNVINNKTENFYVKNNINKNNQINGNKNNKKITKIEEQLKQNILDSKKNRNKQYEEDQKYKTIYQNTSNNYYINKKNNFGFSNQINKKIYSNTPNRIINTNNDIINRNIDIKKRQYSPDIANLNILNINNKKAQEKNIQDIDNDNEEDNLKINLNKNLNELDKLLKYGRDSNSINNINNINNVNDFNKKNNYNNNVNKTPYSNKSLYNSYNNNDSNSNNGQMSTANRGNFYLNENTNKYNYATPINYRNNSRQYGNDSSNDEQNNKRINTNNINNNIPTIPTQYILRDLASNNSIDITRRLDYLEKNVFEIKKDIASMSSILNNLSSNNFVLNNFKEQIKQICDDYINEKMNTYENIKFNNKQNNYNNDNHSLYSEFLNDENRQKFIYENNKKFENEMNKKIDERLEKLGEEIKTHINNNILKPSLNQIEMTMKKNMDEIREKINKINIRNNDYNYNNNYNNINYDNSKKNNMLESIKSSDMDSKNTSKIRNEKYEQINKLGEQLYLKLREKEQKLKMLKEETSKYLEDND